MRGERRPSRELVVRWAELCEVPPGALLDAYESLPRKRAQRRGPPGDDPGPPESLPRHPRPGSGPEIPHDEAGKRTDPRSGRPHTPSAPAAGLSREVESERGARTRRLSTLVLMVGVAVAASLSVLAVAVQLAGDKGPLVARVGVAVDLSAAMGCPLQSAPGERCTRALRAQESALPVEHRRLTRIEAATAFASRGIRDLDQPGDKLAIWGFSTSGGTGPRQQGPRPKAGLEQVLRLGAVADPLSIAARFRGLRATSGGSPLYDMIDTGVRELRKDSPMKGVVNTLVVFTDGASNRSSISREELKARLDAAAQPGQAPVRVLIAVVGDGTCAQLQDAVAEPGDGDCFQAPTQAALRCVSDKIAALLRTPQPRTPRDARTKPRAHTCPRAAPTAL